MLLHLDHWLVTLWMRVPVWVPVRLEMARVGNDTCSYVRMYFGRRV